MKQILLKIPFINKLISFMYLKLLMLVKPFNGSQNYWESRYHSGGNSGQGSYNDLCLFKANILNNFVKDHHINSVIDFGCGDGNQLKVCHYPSYLGFDVSKTVIEQCRLEFKNDSTKQFNEMKNYANETAELGLSLDVIYHLIEDNIFEHYMNQLFNAATRYVILYSSNTNQQQDIQAPHVKHRLFSAWVNDHFPQWVLVEHIKNKYPYSASNPTGSFADFYIYKKEGN